MTETYPAEIYWYAAEPLDDGVLLVVGVNPLQYDPSTMTVTLFTHVALQVVYEAPASTAVISGLVVNSGNPVDTGEASVPLQATIDSEQDQTLALAWRILDAADNALAASRMDVALTTGANTVDFDTSTLGWHPGPMVLAVTLEDGTTAVDFAAASFAANGRSVTASTDRLFYTSAGEPEVRVLIYNEAGAGVPGRVAPGGRF